MTPKEAIRAHCISCAGGSMPEVRDCDGLNAAGLCDSTGKCHFYPYRLNRGRPSVKLIRKFCLCCQGGSELFVRECREALCSLHPFRMGKNPARAGMGNAENLKMSGATST
jgi:hypothetical protein